MLEMPSFDMNTPQRRLCHLFIASSMTVCPKPCQTFVRHCFSSLTSWTWWVSQMHICACIHAKGGHFTFNV